MTLQTLADRFWAKSLEARPTIATVRGVHDYDHLLPGLGDDWVAAISGAIRSIQEETEALDTTGMTTQDRITHSLLLHQCRSLLGELETPFRRVPIDPYLGPHTRLLSDTRQNTVADQSQADALLERYADVPRFLKEALDTHRACVEGGQAPAAAPTRRVIDQIDGYLASPLDDDPFLVLKLPEENPTWRERAETLVKETIRPALDTYRAGLVDELLPRARPDDRCGLVWMTGGEEIYQALIEQYAQLPMSAEEIHDVGQRWATEINAEEWRVIGDLAFGVDSLEEVFTRLHSDPSLRFGSEAEMLEHARTALDRAWAAVDDWFGERNWQKAVGNRVVAKDVGKGRRHDYAEAVILQSPHGVLARGAAPEVRTGDQDGRSVVARLIQDKRQVQRAIGADAPVVKQELAKAGSLDALEELLRDDLIGIDVASHQRDHPAAMTEKALHQRNSH